MNLMEKCQAKRTRMKGPAQESPEIEARTLPAYRVIRSKVVNDTVYLTDTDESAAVLTAAGIRPVYSAREVGELRGLSQESLRAHHLVKKTFPGSIIEKG